MLYLVEWFIDFLIDLTTCDPIQRFIKQQEYNPSVHTGCFVIVIVILNITEVVVL